MTPFVCPLCQTPFEKQNNTQICKNNHHFDIAKEGYLNLLPVNAKNSKNPGDNKEMMQARRAFLNTDGYLPLSNKVNELVKKHIDTAQASTVLDLGCGEGYYTQHLSEYLGTDITICALDISKVAVRYGAKRYKNIHFCVASAYDIPLDKNSLDAVIRIYAPSLDAELQRVIKSEGYLITVTPAPRHLYQLREKIYDDVTLHQAENEAPEGFVKVERVNLSYVLDVTNKAQLEALIDMTPFAWKFDANKRASLLAERQHSIECDFNIEVYQKEKLESD